MYSRAGKYCGILGFLLWSLFFSGGPVWSADEPIQIRLVALLDKDDHGEKIDYPVALFYDYWTSELNLLSSTTRITIYDQNYFPVASFGKGRGLGNPRGLAVDRHGTVYVCQGSDLEISNSPRLSIYNQAFFLVKEIVFAGIPELADFSPERVAVAESGLIYLTGTFSEQLFGGVVVLSPEGQFLRLLMAPEKEVGRAVKKVDTAVTNGQGNAQSSPADPDAAPTAPEPSEAAEVASFLPAELKPKTAAAPGDDDKEKMVMAEAYISDVKIDRQGRIYLLSREISRIYVLNAKEEYLFKFGEKGGVAGKLSNPVSVALDVERRVIYVCDYMRHTVLCYDYDTGKYIFEIGGLGTAPLWFNFPNNVEVDRRGRLVVSDLFNRRVQVMDPNITARRPLSPLPAGPAPVLEPSAAAVLPVPGPLVLPPPAAAALPGPVSLLAVPLGLAAASLPPSPLAPRPPRELLPLRLKMVLAPPARLPQLVAVTPLSPPVLIPRPARVSFSSELRGQPTLRAVGDLPAAIMARFRTLPAAIGVYGPVAALVGVGSWLLHTNR